MTAASQVQTQPLPWWLTLIAGILGALGIIFGITLIVNSSVPGMGLAMQWSVAVIGFLGGIALIVLAFRQRSA